MKDLLSALRILCALFVAQALVPLLVFRAASGSVLLHLYLSVGVAALLYSLIVQRLKQDALRMSFEEQIAALAGRQANVGPWRPKMLTALFVAQFVACWPAFLLGLHIIRIIRTGAKLDTRLAANAALTLFPYESSVSFWLLLGALGTTALAVETGRATVYTSAFLCLLIATLACKHLATLVAPIDAQQRLRQSADPVIASYIFLTLADLVVLLLAYNGLLNWTPVPELSAKSLQGIYDQLQVFKDVFNAWHHLPVAPLGYALGLSGLLWLLTFANSLLKLGANYKRTADDQLVIATASAMVGLSAHALKALEAVEPQTRLQFQQKGSVLAALGFFMEGDRYIAESLRQLSIGSGPPSADHHFMVMWSAVAQISPQLTERLCGQLKYCADAGVTDTLLSTIAIESKSVGADPSAVVQWISGRGLESRFPLAFVNFAWSCDREREVLAFFDALQPPPAGGDHLMWRCTQALLIPVRSFASEEAQAAAIDEWIASTAGELPADMAAASPLHCRLVASRLARVHGYLGQLVDHPIEWVPSAIQMLESKAESDVLLEKLTAPTLPVPVPPRSSIAGVDVSVVRPAGQRA